MIRFKLFIILTKHNIIELDKPCCHKCISMLSRVYRVHACIVICMSKCYHMCIYLL